MKSWDLGTHRRWPYNQESNSKMWWCVLGNRLNGHIQKDKCAYLYVTYIIIHIYIYIIILYHIISYYIILYYSIVYYSILYYVIYYLCKLWYSSYNNVHTSKNVFDAPSSTPSPFQRRPSALPKHRHVPPGPGPEVWGGVPEQQMRHGPSIFNI